MKAITITAIDFADPDLSTDIVHLVTLSDGRTLEIWAGHPCHNAYDEYAGDLRIGARLIRIDFEADGSRVFHFE